MRLSALPLTFSIKSVNTDCASLRRLVWIFSIRALFSPRLVCTAAKSMGLAFGMVTLKFKVSSVVTPFVYFTVTGTFSFLP